MKENEVINTSKFLKVAAGGALILGTTIGLMSSKDNSINCIKKAVWADTYAYCEGEDNFMVIEKEGKKHIFDGRLTGVYEKDGYILVGSNNEEDCSVTVVKNGESMKLNHDIKYPWRISSIKDGKIDYFTVQNDWLEYKTLDVEKDTISTNRYINFSSYSYMNMYPICYK
jgi:hypothetical protein